MGLIFQCVVSCILFTLVILPAQYRDPIHMIASYPPAIIKRVEELPQYKDTIQQRKKAHIGKKLGGLVFFIILFSAVAWFSGCRSFKDAFCHVFTLLAAVNLYDLIVLDWGNFCHSKKLRIPGTEDMEDEYKNYVFHAKGAMIGFVLGFAVSLISGCLVHFASAM